MLLNTSRKDKSKHFSRRATKSASCLLPRDCQFILAVKNRSVKLLTKFELTNKNIMLHVSATKQEI